jgi:hypothetical protein
MRDSYISDNHFNRRTSASIAVHEYQSTGIWSFLKSLKSSHWLLLFYPVFIFLIGRQRGAEELYQIDTSATLQISFTALAGFYVFMRFLNARASYESIYKSILFGRPIRWLLLYLFISAISTLWSDRPEYTLYRALEVLIFLILVADAVSSLKTVENMVKFQLLFGFLLVIFWHYYDIKYGLSLEMLHSSLIPGVIIGVAFLGFLIGGRDWRFIHFNILLSILIGTSSATYLSLLLGIGGVIIFSKGKKRFFGGLLIILTLSFSLAYGPDFLELLFWGKSESNIQTASGRLPVWEWVYNTYVVLKPYFGYGFGQGEVLARFYNITAGGLQMMHMHNVAMGALTNLGFVGLSILILFFVDVLKSVLSFRDYSSRGIIMGATMAVMLNSLSIASISSPLSFGWLGQALLFCMIAIMCINKKAQNAISYRPVKYKIVW